MNLKLKPLFHSYSANCLIVEYNTPITVEMFTSDETYYYLTNNEHDVPETFNEFAYNHINKEFKFICNYETGNFLKQNKKTLEYVEPTIEDFELYEKYLKLKNPGNN